MSVRKGFSIIIFALAVSLMFHAPMSQDNLSALPVTNFGTSMDKQTASLDTTTQQFAKMHESIDRFLKFWNIQGASLAVAKEGEIVYTRGFGYADTVAKRPVDPSNMFRLASVSKLITAVAVMQLAENGKLSLEDYVFGDNGILNHAPYNNYRDKTFEKIKVKHLLNHSGGWTLWYGDPMFSQVPIARSMGKQGLLSNDEIIAYMLQKRLHFQPGASSYYSNLGFVILGKVVESAAQMPYETYVQSHILHPLGIYDMHLGKNRKEEWLPNEVHYYEQPDADLVESCYGTGEYIRRCEGGSNMESLEAAGAWIGSAQSMLKLVLTIDGDGKPFDILSKKSIQVMTEPDSLGFSPYGWRKTDQYGDWIRTGTLAGSTCLVEKEPNGLTYVIFCNTSPWKGSEFPFIMKRFMDRELSKVDAFKTKNAS